jgi:2-amino-4-hydroxy-6-hydroxymethyldihydropteridine diphosphokinase
MAVVYLGLGSNMQPAQNLRMAVDCLRSRFTNVVLSNSYQSGALGFEGDDFINLVARIETDLSLDDVLAVLEEIHDKSGRERGCAKFVSRPLDIDLLLYDRLVDVSRRVPRSDVLEYSFVLIPLAEIAADYVHPVSGQSIAEHCQEFDKSSHPLTKQDLDL